VSDRIQRGAWFHVFIEAEDEAIATLWMNTVNSMLDACAKKAAEASNGKVKLLSAMESGQSVPLYEEPPKKREDV
jgi:hypothetical protein